MGRFSPDFKFGDFKPIELTSHFLDTVYSKVRQNEKLQLILLLQNKHLGATIELLANINYFAIKDGKNFFVVRINFQKEKIYEVRFYADTEDKAILKLKQFMDGFDFSNLSKYSHLISSDSPNK